MTDALAPLPPEVLPRLLAAARHQVPEALLALGLAYQEGLGVPQDRDRARAWLALAASHSPRAGCPHGRRAAREPGQEALFEGLLGDTLPAFYRVLQAADGYAGQFAASRVPGWKRWYARRRLPASARAEFALGRLAQGCGCAGLGWFRRAAEGGVAEAQVHLGLVHRARGEAEAARRWFGRARAGLLPEARGRNPEACYRLGVLLLEGWGGDLDPVGAARWLRVAADAGHPDSRARLALLGRVLGGPAAGLAGPTTARTRPLGPGRAARAEAAEARD